MCWGCLMKNNRLKIKKKDERTKRREFRGRKRMISNGGGGRERERERVKREKFRERRDERMKLLEMEGLFCEPYGCYLFF